jgi:hypothetical protein
MNKLNAVLLSLVAVAAIPASADYYTNDYDNDNGNELVETRKVVYERDCNCRPKCSTCKPKCDTCCNRGNSGYYN